MPPLLKSTHSQLSKIVKDNEKKYSKCEFYKIVKKLCEENEKRLKSIVYRTTSLKKFED